MTGLSQLGADLSVAVIGASGGIGAACVDALIDDPSVTSILACSRSGASHSAEKVECAPLDLNHESSIEAAAQWRSGKPFDLVIVATGVLHTENMQPEKSWRDLSQEHLLEAMRINAVGPALVAKHFLPRLRRDGPSVFAALSARVGSISDNRLGGWYGYRASKAALNMLIKSLAIELARKNPDGICIGLHPGTVDTALSAPFQRGVPAEKLFTSDRAARQLIDVIAACTSADSGDVFAWDGSRVPA